MVIADFLYECTRDPSGYPGTSVQEKQLYFAQLENCAHIAQYIIPEILSNCKVFSSQIPTKLHFSLRVFLLKTFIHIRFSYKHSLDFHPKNTKETDI